MKTYLLLLLLCLTTSFIYSQSHGSLVLIVEDDATQIGVKGAIVSIKEAGYYTKVTDATGKVVFDNITVGEVNYLISKEGYLLNSGRMNISVEAKNDTFRVLIWKIPSASENKILIIGEVSNPDGKELSEVSVEIEIANLTRTATTNYNGFYSIDIDIDSTSENIRNVKIKMKKGDFNTEKVVRLPRSRVVNLDLELNDDADQPLPKSAPIPIPRSLELTVLVNGVTLTLERYKQTNDTLSFYFKLVYVSNLNSSSSKEIFLPCWVCQLVDRNGNEYKGEYISLVPKSGNIVSKKLMYGIPILGEVRFRVNEVINDVAFLNIPFFHGMQFVNLKLSDGVIIKSDSKKVHGRE